MRATGSGSCSLASGQRRVPPPVEGGALGLLDEFIHFSFAKVGLVSQQACQECGDAIAVSAADAGCSVVISSESCADDGFDAPWTDRLDAALSEGSLAQRAQCFNISLSGSVGPALPDHEFAASDYDCWLVIVPADGLAVVEGRDEVVA